MSDIVRRPADAAHGAIASPGQPLARPNPLAALPLPWREPVAKFYAFHADILKGTTGIVARLCEWRADHALTLEEAGRVLARLKVPARCAAFSYAGQLLAALAEEVAAEIAKRAERIKADDDRRQFAREANRAAPAAMVGEVLGGRLDRYRAEDGLPPRPPKAGEP